MRTPPYGMCMFRCIFSFLIFSHFWNLLINGLFFSVVCLRQIVVPNHSNLTCSQNQKVQMVGLPVRIPLKKASWALLTTMLMLKSTLWTHVTTMGTRNSWDKSRFPSVQSQNNQWCCCQAPCSLTFKMNTLTMYEIYPSLILTNIGPPMRKVINMSNDALNLLIMLFVICSIS